MSARKALISVHRTCSALAAYGSFLVSCAGNRVPFSPPPLCFPQLSSPYTSETTVTTGTCNNWSTDAEILQEFRTAFTSEKAALRWYLSSCSSSLCSCGGYVPGLVWKLLQSLLPWPHVSASAVLHNMLERLQQLRRLLLYPYCRNCSFRRSSRTITAPALLSPTPLVQLLLLPPHNGCSCYWHPNLATACFQFAVTPVSADAGLSEPGWLPSELPFGIGKCAIFSVIILRS